MAAIVATGRLIHGLVLFVLLTGAHASAQATQRSSDDTSDGTLQAPRKLNFRFCRAGNATPSPITRSFGSTGWRRAVLPLCFIFPDSDEETVQIILPAGFDFVARSMGDGSPIGSHSTTADYATTLASKYGDGIVG